MDATEVASWWTRRSSSRTRCRPSMRKARGERERSRRTAKPYSSSTRTCTRRRGSRARWRPARLGGGRDRAAGRRDGRTAALSGRSCRKGADRGAGFESVRHSTGCHRSRRPPPEPVWPGASRCRVSRRATKRSSTRSPRRRSPTTGATSRAISSTGTSTRSEPGGGIRRSSYLVREGDEVVAAEINAFRFGDGLDRHARHARSVARPGLGRALLLTAFASSTAAAPGSRSAVDAGNETGATHLYESVGMRVSAQADVYEKRVGRLRACRACARSACLQDVHRRRARARVPVPRLRARVRGRARSRAARLGPGGEAMAEAASLELPYPGGLRRRGGLARRAGARARSELPERPLILGGCCCSHIGAVEGLAARHGRLAVVWVDAHGDLNTPESSPSGNEWGMPLRMLLDSGAVDAQDVALVGARDLDPPEREFIARAASTPASTRSTAR